MCAFPCACLVGGLSKKVPLSPSSLTPSEPGFTLLQWLCLQLSSFYAFKVPGASGSSTDVKFPLLSEYLHLGVPLVLCAFFMKSVNWSEFPWYDLGYLSGCSVGYISFQLSLLLEKMLPLLIWYIPSLMQCVHSGLPHPHTLLHVHKRLLQAPRLRCPFSVPHPLIFFQHENAFLASYSNCGVCSSI